MLTAGSVREMTAQLCPLMGGRCVTITRPEENVGFVAVRSASWEDHGTRWMMCS